MADGDYGWLWQNERMSDMELVITTTESLERLPKRRRLEAPAPDKQSDGQPSSQQDTKPGRDLAVAPAAAASAANVGSKVQSDATASKGAGGPDTETGTASAQQEPSRSNAQSSSLQKRKAGSDNNDVGAMPEGTRIQASRIVLSACSEYFRTRVTGWDDDPHTLRGKDGRPVLVVAVEPELTEAAQAVVRLMYDGMVAEGMSATQLAQMCKIADMWGALACLRKCFTALSQATELLAVDDLAGLCSLLPDIVTTFPSYSQWKSRLQQCVVKAFPDVYTLLTTYDQLQRFRLLPFHAVLAWAESDGLVVDSEYSVAVAISWWYGGDLGSQATEDQLKELSGALRLKHLSNAYRMTQLRLLPWFSYDQRQLDWFCVAAANGMLPAGVRHCPPGWFKPPRKQLDAQTRSQRYNITWDVPQSELEGVLSNKESTRLRSLVVYAAGSGWQLRLQVEKEAGSKPRGIGIYFSGSSYTCQGQEVVPESDVTQVKFTITHQPPGGAPRNSVAEAADTFLYPSGWGRVAFRGSSMAALRSYLCDGCLKLAATFEVIH